MKIYALIHVVEKPFQNHIREKPTTIGKTTLLFIFPTTLCVLTSKEKFSTNYNFYLFEV
jgi:hypothetical protein